MNKTVIQNMQLKKYFYHKAVKQGIPITTNFELTPVCNFNCRMCYIHQSQETVNKHNRPMMSVDEWITLAEKMKEQGTLYILLTGGEPLLWPNFWKLYETLYGMGFLISVNSNGSLITEEVIKRFLKMPPLQVNITLYGSSDETYFRLCGVRGVYSKVVNAIEGLQRNGILVRLNGSVTPDNAADLKEMIMFAKEHHLPFKSSTYMFPPLRKGEKEHIENARFTPEEAAIYRLEIQKYQLGDEGYRWFLKKLLEGSIDPIGFDEECIDSADGQIRCMAGRGSCWVNWDGYLSLCGMIPDFRIDLRTTEFDDAWTKLKEISSNLSTSGSCTKCENSNLCHSCAAAAYAETGNVGGTPLYLCEMIQKMREIATKEINCI